MKNLKFFILFVAIALINCERDDICAEATQTTARFIIEFYDAANPNVLKNVPRITVYGEGLITDENGLPIEPTNASAATLKFNENANRLELPLKIEDVPEGQFITTKFIIERDTNLRLDTESPETSNIDILEITYTSEFIYVSRACGYKSVFTNLNVIRETDSDPWMANIQILQTTIDNENTAHVRILH